MLTSTHQVRIPARFQGPPFCVNGGYLAGILARLVGPSAEIRLEAPVPFDEELSLRHQPEEEVVILQGEQVLARARPAAAPAPLAPPTGEDFDRVEPPDLERHPFPACFVCGHHRQPGDALAIPLHTSGDGTVVARWTPHPGLADGDGRLPLELVWAALDCPSGWAVFAPGEVGLLGTIRGSVGMRPAEGEAVTVLARQQRGEGRKRRAAVTLFDTASRPYAWAEAIWIAI